MQQQIAQLIAFLSDNRNNPVVNQLLLQGSQATTADQAIEFFTKFSELLPQEE